ncbi:MAG TPA: DUF2306 domain-containing protein [Pirellulaceae bacterium]|jgi:uncharacterized membrane protein
MPNATGTTLNRLLTAAAVLLVAKVTLTVLFGYRDYLPPNFNADFLLGRESYFYGPYSWAFYIHLLSGPLSLILGTILISQAFRRRFPRWHRRLGRLQVANVLLLVAPSGLWMARYAMSGAIAGMGLAFLALATAFCCTAGWRSAVARQFGDHQLWMWRTYLLLCSAVIIRLFGGLATVFQFDPPWVYPTSVWASWLVPLAIFEARRPVNASPAPFAVRS